ncbi:P-loop containing nucleoside triphosphate hydrolase protein [Chaetomidium leptoderma]|uniref:P-loop containing nucleoside triphosphate hydrolase protein n=1 Tax=Chaetomidium leptoderma TaxID=669021 RepID=A0AAN6VR60_9PEZI|nr:P-loop containing nucleoside triphosphate hydrolase protein [Chaetomidium leptoderma]
MSFWSSSFPSCSSGKLITADHITDVTWNKQAFQRLVLSPKTKELIQAAVMAQGHLLGASPDIIAGKGQGLLILLHGGPGTGKTLTAESIAETQERPLYRVTCGDLGIEPTDVELVIVESVFNIGKAWGCVVLLDEADVFLEERIRTNQKQNAVVSVFLRLLEYYDGILILTTNRVGTFDEAFKSRIHLALRYPDLGETQRAEIWCNFIEMLKNRTGKLVDNKDLVDINDLLANVPKLAQRELNGRQIRNALMVARYLSKFGKEVLRYQHVQDALEPMVEFNQYLVGLRGLSDEEIAAEERLR